MVAYKNSYPELEVSVYKSRFIRKFAKLFHLPSIPLMVIRYSIAHLTEVKLLPRQNGGYSKALE